MAELPNYFKEPLNQPKLAAAVLAACIVQTLNESDPTFAARFHQNLSRSYSEVRDWPASIDVLEVLAWTLEMVKRGNVDLPPDQSAPSS